MESTLEIAGEDDTIRKVRKPAQFHRCVMGDPRSEPPQTPAPPAGFASLSDFQASDPDLQIYRRFDSLAARNIAYMQSELAALNASLEALDDEDRQLAEAREEGWMEATRGAHCWELSERRANEGDEREGRRMQLAKRLRSLMAEYQEALVQQSQVLNLGAPPRRASQALKAWFEHHWPLVGRSYDVYHARHDGDLVALRTIPDQDRLTLFLQQHFGRFLRTHRLHGAEEWEGIAYFSEVSIRRLVSVFSVVISAGLLVGAIAALYYAPDYPTKIGLIAMFTVLFAASVGLLTNARKAEVYGSTAAYAAVLVVFISGNF